MKHIRLNPTLSFRVLLGVLVTSSCTDKWDEHYDEASFDLPDKTLMETIRENPELSTFTGMLESTGYDAILDASQSYTVWAPLNSALEGFDGSDPQSVMETVQNHIARSRHTTSGITEELVQMLDGKYIVFTRGTSGYSFGNNDIIEPNLPAVNGLIHILDGYAPYLNNLWEYIGRTEGLDSLRSYLNSQDQVVFDPANSTELGVNGSGQTIYDSAFLFTNPVLDRIGAIDSEDSIYTAIIPDNTAWTEAYGRIAGYYNFPDDAGSITRQRGLTQWTLVKDMLFRGIISQPGSLDSLVSSTGTVFYEPAGLFSGTQQNILSNGLGYVTDLMPYADTLSWFREIRVEAEDPEGRSNSSSNVFLRNSYGSGLDVSGNQYILVDPVSAEPRVEFSIPNTLSARYNIYCVFVPATVVDPSDFTPTKVKFVLTYIRRSSGSTFIRRITPVNNVTDTVGVTKMLVDQFDFEYANIIDEDYDRVAVKLEVSADVTTEEEQSGEFSRTMRVDCIIFEPVAD